MISAALLAAAPVSAWAQKFDGLAPTPQMGWNSWNRFACNIDDKLIQASAQRLHAAGAKQ